MRHVLDTLDPLERRVTREDQQAHYIMRILPYRAPDSTVSGTLVTFLDVTSIVQAEQHHRLLVDELNHRVKNMLTVVVSLAAQTLRRSATLEEFSEAFMGRVQALTASYTLLSGQNWLSVSLQDLLTEETRPYAAPDHNNIVMDGPPVRLAAAGVLAIGMAIHELATNAIKYGALSVREGIVTINWRFDYHRWREAACSGLGRGQRSRRSAAGNARFRNHAGRARPGARIVRQGADRLCPAGRPSHAARARRRRGRGRTGIQTGQRHVTSTLLTGKRVMVAEDELLISMLIEDVLADAGCLLVGPFSNVSDALAAAKDARSTSPCWMSICAGR